MVHRSISISIQDCHKAETQTSLENKPSRVFQIICCKQMMRQSASESIIYHISLHSHFISSIFPFLSSFVYWVLNFILKTKFRDFSRKFKDFIHDFQGPQNVSKTALLQACLHKYGLIPKMNEYSTDVKNPAITKRINCVGFKQLSLNSTTQ